MTERPRIYLDHAAATPLSAEARAALQAGSDCFGNPSAIHTEGRTAAAALVDARTRVARTLGVRAEGVLFTASGTEANNLALAGTLAARRRAGQPLSALTVITTELEHPSVLALFADLATEGLTVRFAPLTDTGIIDVSEFAKLLGPKVVVVSCAYASSEVGVVQPVRAIARAIARHYHDQATRPVLHVDAAQAPYWLPCQREALGADLMALDAGKCGGPKGVGVLVRRADIELKPLIYGGGQEQGLRAGTENVAGILAAATAIASAQDSWRERSERVATVRDAALAELPQLVPAAVLNGPTGTERIANNINISVPGHDTEYAVIALDAAGIAISTKSACAGAGGGESRAVRAITGSAERAKSTLRLTLGPDTTLEEVRAALRALADHLVLMQPYTDAATGGN